MEMPSITALVITNPDWFGTEEHLAACLETVDWCKARLIVTAKTTPWLEKMAKTYQATLILQEGSNFAEWREHAIHQVETDWLLQVDTDERVLPELKKEIIATITGEQTFAGYAIPRINRILGRDMYHGGWWPDYVLRLIKMSAFKGYQGALHEQPILEGETSYLRQPFWHLKHDDLESMVKKTNVWSDTEAKLLIEANHPPMNLRRFLRPLLTEIFARLVVKKGVWDGPEGLIDGVYQGYSRVITYIKLWESQVNSQTK